MGTLHARPAVPLPTLGEVNDLGKPWRYEDGEYMVTRTALCARPDATR